MSDKNQAEGHAQYLMEEDSRPWFLEQLKQWPKRVNDKYTTNISYLYGGVLAHRELYGITPDMSKDYANCLKWMDNG